jgi:hypothetical protein
MSERVLVVAAVCRGDERQEEFFEGKGFYEK